MIISIGTDIVEVNRIRDTLSRTPKLKARVFTPSEIAYCDEATEQFAMQRFAARFAAKEAALKALGTGLSNGINWQDIEVVLSKFDVNKEQDHNVKIVLAAGAPSLFFHNRAREIFEQIGANMSHLSLSHTSLNAVAMVVLEKI
ncbi:MAG: holo-ACP synthase [Pyrinomonadaceae bacterium]